MRFSIDKKISIIFVAFTAFAGLAYADAPKLVEASKFYPFLDKYLSLPPSDRDGIIVEYFAHVNGKPPENVFFHYKGTRTKIAFDSKGKVATLPNLDQLKNGEIEYIGTKGAKFSIGFTGRPNLPVTEKYDVASLKNSITDMKASMKVAGPIAAFIPKMNSLVFKGVNYGHAIMQNGNKLELEKSKEGIIFSPFNKKYQNAIRIELASKPQAVDFEK